MIYLDSAATTPIHPEVLQSMRPWIMENFANAGAVYGAGRKAKEAIESARAKVAKLFAADPENIVFTSGGSEGNSFAFHAAAERLRSTNKKHVLVSSVEHDSVLRAAEGLIKQGFHVELLPVCPGGYVRIDDVRRAITPETGLISVMYVNNETGTVNNLESIGRLCAENEILFHTDCVQAAGLLPIDVSSINCDFATASAHKFHGPKGIGCVYVKDTGMWEPMIYGGHGQEHGLRGGTENVSGIVGMGTAAEIAARSMSDTQKHVVKLRSYLWEYLSQELKNTVHLNGQCFAVSKVLNVRIDDIDSDTMVLAMDAAGVSISAGSACRSFELTPNRTLTAMGLSPDEARSSVRISFSSMNTEDDVRYAGRALVKCVKLLRGEIDDLKE